jgi:Bacteriophage HK97-gp10, putative tail-component
MKGKIHGVAKDTPRAAQTGVAAEAQRLLTESQKRVPVKTGALRDSGRVRIQEPQGKQISAQIDYTMPYAVVVHEDLEAHHDNGQAKYLESVLRENAPSEAQRLAAHLDLSKLVK